MPALARNQSNGVIGIDLSAYKDLLDGVKDLKSANREYTLASQYYEGTRPEWFANVRYQIALARSGTTYRMNFAKTAVDAVVDRLEINGIAAGDKATSDALQAVLDANQWDLEVGEIHKRACEFGDAYLLIWPNDDIANDDEDDEDDSNTANRQGADNEASEGAESTIDLYYNDPRTMRMFYDEENPREKRYVIKRWKTGKVFRVNLYYKDRIEKWVSKPESRGDRAEEWLHYDDGSGAWPTDNPWGRIPVFHFRTSRPYGTPEHVNAYGPQDAITKIVVTHMATMDYHGFPQRWALMGGDLDDGDDNLEDFGWDGDPTGPDEATSAAGSANRTTVRAEPGQLWLLRNVKSVGQFDAAKADVFLQPFDVYVRAMAQLTTTPLHYFDPAGGTPSGESLRVADAPMVKKAKNRQKSFGSTWQDACEFILMIAGHPDPTGTVHISWENAASQNDLLTWDLAMYKKSMGIPIWQILLEAGYTQEQMTEWGVPPAKWDAAAGYAPVTKLPSLRQANSSSL